MVAIVKKYIFVTNYMSSREAQANYTSPIHLSHILLFPFHPPPRQTSHIPLPRFLSPSSYKASFYNLWILETGLVEISPRLSQRGHTLDNIGGSLQPD